MPVLETISKREAIVLAAADCFAASGFAATRISEVAERAGVGKGTVYEYFGSKEELLLATCQALCRLRLEKLRGIIAGYLVGAAGKQIDPAVTLHELVRLLLF